MVCDTFFQLLVWRKACRIQLSVLKSTWDLNCACALFEEKILCQKAACWCLKSILQTLHVLFFNPLLSNGCIICLSFNEMEKFYICHEGIVILPLSPETLATAWQVISIFREPSCQMDLWRQGFYRLLVNANRLFHHLTAALTKKIKKVGILRVIM